ncbi:predicted protein [Nematostella vectensis]|uniref:Uncharacterized protein n=1 Tax=Nematostella vectensis TaxID=45351 RepID=A7SFI7_NEMVE|nr:predicted protein [Nematostella vectensis]|eukprot:XP_001629570.1 predicted protein [Nematostella vectensis]
MARSLPPSLNVAAGCGLGEYYNRGICKQCSPSCPGKQIIVHPCTESQDISCRCPEGKYWDTALLLCRQCMACKAGQYPVVQCKHESNRVCKDCMEGTYLNSTLDMCLPCSHCKVQEVVLKMCGKDSNTICTRNVLKSTNTTTKSTTEPPTAAIQIKQGETAGTLKTSENKNVIIIAVASVVGVFLIAIVALLWCGRHHNSTPQRRVPETSQTIIDEEMDSIINSDPGLHLRDLDYETFENLCNLLNPESLKNWKTLAGLLRLPMQQIRVFEIDKSQATQKLLGYWQTQQEASVYKLYHLLLEIHRDDCASLLKKVLLKHQQSRESDKV